MVRTILGVVCLAFLASGSEELERAYEWAREGKVEKLRQVLESG